MGKNLKGKELGEHIKQRKDGRYEARFTNRFGKRISFYDASLTVVRKRLNEALYEDAKKLNIVNDKTTLDEWYVEWLTVYKYGVIREDTKANYVRMYKKHISPALGSMRLQDITQLQIRHMLIDMDKAGYGYEMKNKCRILLVDMFNKALIDEYVRRNPAKGITLKRDEKKDVRVLSRKEQSEFFDCCKGTFYNNLFVVAVNTGLRIGEAAALREQDIDFDNMVIHIVRTLVYQKYEDDEKKMFHFEDPKTYTSKRDIPINRQCEIALKKQLVQKRVIASKTPKKVEEQFSDLIFTTKYNTPLNPQIMCDAIKKIVNEINLCKEFIEEMESFSFHCFRHTFATRCFESDIAPKTVQSYLGHATLQMTMDLYTSVLKEHSESEMGKLDDTMGKFEELSDVFAEEEYSNMKNSNVLDFGVKMGSA